MIALEGTTRSDLTELGLDREEIGVRGSNLPYILSLCVCVRERGRSTASKLCTNHMKDNLIAAELTSQIEKQMR